LSVNILEGQFLQTLLCSFNIEDFCDVWFTRHLCFDAFHFLFCEFFANKDYFNSLITTSASAVLEFWLVSTDPSCILLPPPLWPSPAQSVVFDMHNDYTINDSVFYGGSPTESSRICSDPDVYLDLVINNNSPSLMDHNDFNTVNIARVCNSHSYSPYVVILTSLIVCVVVIA
jgi:hypothetical protein